MTRVENVKNLIALENLIRKRGTGTPKELARRLSMSRSSLYELIDELKSHDVKIRYCRTNRTFHYNCNKVIEVKFDVKIITDSEELRNISGGCAYFSLKNSELLITF
jgi:hypothetical protein